MLANAAVLYEVNKPLVVEDVEVLEPGAHEVRVKWAANGVHAISGMGGVDFAFEVVGTQKTVEQALASTHRGGMCVVVGVCPSGTRISVDPTMLLQQRVLTGTSFGGGHQRKDVPDLIDLYMSGKYQLKEMVSRRLPLSELNHAFDLMKQGEVKRSVIVYE